MSHCVLRKTDQQQSSLRCILLMLADFKDEEQILKASKKKKKIQGGRFKLASNVLKTISKAIHQQSSIFKEIVNQRQICLSSIEEKPF